MRCRAEDIDFTIDQLLDGLWQRTLLLTFNFQGHKMEIMILTIPSTVINYLNKITYFKVLFLVEECSKTLLIILRYSYINFFSSNCI